VGIRKGHRDVPVTGGGEAWNREVAGGERDSQGLPVHLGSPHGIAIAKKGTWLYQLLSVTPRQALNLSESRLPRL
jgi:hypothetical protein